MFTVPPGTDASAVFLGVVFGFLSFAGFEPFAASGTIGTLIQLVACALATIGAARLLFFSGTRSVAGWEAVVPALALVLIAYTVPQRRALSRRCARDLPGGRGGGILAGIVIVPARPAAARRAGS